MGLNPHYIKESINEIGYKEAFSLLKDWINNSNDPDLRKEALEVFGHLDNGRNFRFFEQIFLSDEDPKMRLLSGNLLKERYINHKKLISLLEFTLSSVEKIDQKFLAIKILNSLKSKKAHKIIKEFLKRSIKKYFSGKIKEFPEEIFNTDKISSISESVLELCYNLILFDYYKRYHGYNVTLRKGIIILLNCENSDLNRISEIPAFYKLIKLEHLLLQGNKINEIDNLEHLQNLKVLDLTNNQIKKIKNIDALRNLEELKLSTNQIRKIENLNLPKLRKLSLDRNSIIEIGNLQRLINLEFLNLGYNVIEKVENLGALYKLKNLNLSNNQIEEISGLDNLTRLISLRINANNIKHLSGLDNLFELKILNLSNNLIEHIENLNNLYSLTKLELSNNKIKKIKGLDHLIKLQELFLDKNRITKLEGIENLESLIILFLENNYISEFRIGDIEHLKNLNFIFLNENPLSSESKKQYAKKTRFP